MKVAVLKAGRASSRRLAPLRRPVEDALERLCAARSSRSTSAPTRGAPAAERPSVAFVAMHGVDGEDGTVQEPLEAARASPSTSRRGAASCAPAPSIDTARPGEGGDARRRRSRPRPFALHRGRLRDPAPPTRLPDPGQPGFPLRGQAEPRRPSSLGSAEFAGAPRRGARRPRRRLSYDDGVMLERYRRAASWRSASSAPSRCRSSSDPGGGDPYDFEARYEIGRTRFVCRRRPLPTERAAVTDAALATCRALGCEGFAAST